MKILALESSAGPAGVAALSDGKILYEAYANVGLTHSQTIMPMMEEALKITQLKIENFDFLAVACGPGSFTGVRIGVAAAKGMAFGSGKKCVGVSTLEAMAYNIPACDAIVVSAMDARCSQVYCGIFKSESGTVTRLSPDRAISIDELQNELIEISETIYLVGDGAELVFKSIKDKLSNVRLAPPAQRYQRASSVALCAEKMLENGYEAVSGDKLEVVYLRLPQAERELNLKKSKEQKA